MDQVKPTKGIALLITVIVIGITGFAVMAFLARSGLISTRNSQSQENGMVARSQVFGCVDEVVAQYLRNPEFNNNAVSLGSTICTVTTLESNPTEKTLELQVVKSDATQIIHLRMGLDPISIISIE
ncbi:hypothetical protein KJ673_03085 [Patescibacteria group bacterium]|nr:hypothetical protein [Patescibacteria group bacterium]MCG2687186.1 hypothetical protein [Candidatus Parcubacteria bacterium]